MGLCQVVEASSAAQNVVEVLSPSRRMYGCITGGINDYPYTVVIPGINDGRSSPHASPELNPHVIELLPFGNAVGKGF